jgi:hypothetical protein
LNLKTPNWFFQLGVFFDFYFLKSLQS